MNSTNEQVRIEVTASRRFVREVLQEAQREDLFIEVDEENITDPVLVAINELVEIAGGEIEVPEGPASTDQGYDLGALIGRRYHINIGRAAWKSLIASVPLAVTLIRAQAGDPTAIIAAGGSALGFIDVYRDNVQKLEPYEVTLYLAVKALMKQTKKHAKAADVAGFLSTETPAERQWPTDEVQKMLERMTQKKVLVESTEGYHIVV